MIKKLPIVSFVGDLSSVLAAFRLRVESITRHLNLPYIYNGNGDITVVQNHTFNVNYVQDRLKKHNSKLIYDIAANHFDDEYKKNNIDLCKYADAITCSSVELSKKIKEHTDVDAVIINDAYETPELTPEIKGEKMLWFGHAFNINSVQPYLNFSNLTVLCNDWSLHKEFEELKKCDIVLLTGNSIYASENRLVKSLRAGKFVITPSNVPSWNEFKNFIWIGDVNEGLEWFNNNREEALFKIKQGQDFIRDKFDPVNIAKQWRNLFLKTYLEYPKSA